MAALPSDPKDIVSFAVTVTVVDANGPVTTATVNAFPDVGGTGRSVGDDVPVYLRGQSAPLTLCCQRSDATAAAIGTNRWHLVVRNSSPNGPQFSTSMVINIATTPTVPITIAP